MVRVCNSPDQCNLVHKRCRSALRVLQSCAGAAIPLARRSKSVMLHLVICYTGTGNPQIRRTQAMHMLTALQMCETRAAHVRICLLSGPGVTNLMHRHCTPAKQLHRHCKAVAQVLLLHRRCKTVAWALRIDCKCARNQRIRCSGAATL